MVTFTPLPTDIVRALQAGGPDTHGQTPERGIANGDELPCRHCLKLIPEGAEYLTLAHRPFPAPQPFAETGPIYLCAEPCEAGGGADLPEVLTSPDYLVKGYGHDDRILYGTGAIIPRDTIPARAETLFERDEVAYVHVRSALNNCYHMRIDRTAG